eukprot:3388874-Prymnesium_polylepis.1
MHKTPLVKGVLMRLRDVAVSHTSNLVARVPHEKVTQAPLDPVVQRYVRLTAARGCMVADPNADPLPGQVVAHRVRANAGAPARARAA